MASVTSDAELGRAVLPTADHRPTAARLEAVLTAHRDRLFSGHRFCWDHKELRQCGRNTSNRAGEQKQDSRKGCREPGGQQGAGLACGT